MKNTQNMIQSWSAAARLRTLPIPIIQVLTGSALAYSTKGDLDWGILLFTCLIAIFITIGTNLINDVFDFEKGADGPKRLGFLKVIGSGLIPKEQIRCAGLISFALAILFSIPLALHAGWILFFLVMLSAVCGYAYTGGPYPISYLGLSEVFILVFYGGVCVGASYYVQTGFFSGQAFLCSMQMGLLAILPNAMNNFRDIHEDEENEKRTLAVRFGKTFARWEIASVLFLPFILGLAWVYYDYLPAALLPLTLAPMSLLFIRTVWMTDPGPLFNRLFGFSVLLHFLFGLLMSIGFFLEPVQ